MLLEGLERYLSQQHGACNIKTQYFNAASSQLISVWEKSTGLILPSDVNGFYSSYNGIEMTWQYSCNKTPEDVGSIHVSSLSDLIILNPKSFEKHHYYKNILPSFINTTVVVFDSTKHVGLICLLYREQSGMASVFDGIWVIDLSLKLHKICSTFSEYLRLAIVHLGLSEWQNLLLPTCQLSQHNAVWHEIFLPKRLEMDLFGDSSDYPEDNSASSRIQIVKFNNSQIVKHE